MWAFVLGMFVGLIILLVGAIFGGIIAAFVYNGQDPEKNVAFRGD